MFVTFVHSCFRRGAECIFGFLWVSFRLCVSHDHMHNIGPLTNVRTKLPLYLARVQMCEPLYLMNARTNVSLVRARTQRASCVHTHMLPLTNLSTILSCTNACEKKWLRANCLTSLRAQKWYLVNACTNVSLTSVCALDTPLERLYNICLSQNRAQHRLAQMCAKQNDNPDG